MLKSNQIILVDYAGVKYRVDDARISDKCIGCQRLITCLINEINKERIENSSPMIYCPFFLTRNMDHDESTVFRNFKEYCQPSIREFEYSLNDADITDDTDDELVKISDTVYKNIIKDEDDRKRKVMIKEAEEKIERQKIHEYIQTFKKNYVFPPEPKETRYPFVNNKKLRKLYLSNRTKIEKPTPKLRYDDAWDMLSKVTQYMSFEEKVTSHISDIEAWLHGEDV